MERCEVRVNVTSHPSGERIRRNPDSDLKGLSWVEGFPGQDNEERKIRDVRVSLKMK